MDPYNTAEAPNAPANPYAAPVARVEETAHEGSGLVKADRVKRLLAVLIDSMVLVVPILLAIAIPAYQDYVRRASGQASVASPFPVFVFAVLGVLVLGFASYQLYWLWKNGQTLGKKTMKIRIVRTDGSRAGLGRLFWLRFFVPGVISNIPLVGGVCALVDPLFIFADDRRCVHDMIADTIVVDC